MEGYFMGSDPGYFPQISASGSIRWLPSSNADFWQVFHQDQRASLGRRWIPAPLQTRKIWPFHMTAFFHRTQVFTCWTVSLADAGLCHWSYSSTISHLTLPSNSDILCKTENFFPVPGHVFHVLCTASRRFLIIIKKCLKLCTALFLFNCVPFPGSSYSLSPAFQP